MIVTLFKSVQKAYTTKDWIIDADWPTIATFLTTFNQCSKKEDMQLFNLWQFDVNGEPGRRRIYENGVATENYETIPNTIQRSKKNAQACWGLVLDYDGEARIDETIADLTRIGCAFAIYTTFRHTEETHKYRIVLPFRSAATPNQLKKKEASISETFQKVDHASFSQSQSFYLHSGPCPLVAYSAIFDGEFLDVDWFEDEPEVEIEKREMPKSEFTGDRNVYKEMLIDSLATCSGLHYANEASKHGVLTLVALCKSADFTFAEFDTICQNMADPTSSLQNPNLRKSAWYGWTPFSGITAKVREEFISAYGGTSKFGINGDTLSRRVKMLKEKLKKRSYND
jgi:hypothetical protein